MNLSVEEIIKELDPDYHRCIWGGKIFHVSDMIFTKMRSPKEIFTIYSCKDEKCIEEHKP